MNIPCEVLISIFAVIVFALFLGFKVHFDKKGIKLEKNDQKQQETDKEHEQRITTIEKKNGNEQHQLDEHKQEITELKKDKGELKDMVIKLQERIINCENQGNGKKHKRKH